ncbi:cell division protein FtsW [Candidatus Woesebacteria bacterium]|nr:cell division protein FtsW [Candidatus Woesebacteria bacterium]MBP9687498.1 cell division protein FtsW [Candidatus Woesebacteria bacterium]
MRRIHKSQPAKQKRIQGFDKTFAALALLLTILGLLSVANTSAPLATATFNDPYFFIKQQLTWAVIGLVGLVVAAIFPLEIMQRYSRVFFYATVICLVVVLIPGFGSKALGARRWIALGPVGFQPSELIKLALAMFFADLAARKAPLKHYIWSLGGVAALIMLQPDLGTTITIVVIAFTQLFIIGFPLFSLGVVAASGAFATLILILTSTYRRARLLTFFSPHDDPSGVDYHVRQIMIALGSGGLFGLGIGQSRQKQLFLPETATDSVFAVISEEMGFFGASAVILLLLGFIFRAVKIAKKADGVFAQTLAIGISGWIAGQMFFNIASMVALTPLTGIPLPFFSYGGSSLTMMLVSVGILLNISAHGKQN